MRLDLALGFGLAFVLSPPALVVQAQTLDPLWDQGNAALDAGDFTTAERIWREVIRLDPDNAIAYIRLALALNGQGDLGGEIAAYRRALEIDSTNANAHNNLGEALIEQSENIPADCWNSYGGPADLRATCAAAFDASQQAREAAIGHFRQAIALDPDYAIAYNNLGLALPTDDAEATAAFRRAVEIDPDFAAAHYNLGYGLYSAAVELFIYLDGPEGFGEEIRDAATLEEAVYHFERSIALNPNTPAFVYAKLGRAYQLQGKLTLAIETFQQALALAPDDTDTLNNLAEAERELALQTTPEPSLQEDLAWLPQSDPLLPILRSVVRVAVDNSGGPDIGAGWVVQRQDDRLWVVTNRHVITDENANRPSRKIEVEFFSNPPPGRVPLRRVAELVQVSPELDLALLLVEAAPRDIEALAISRRNPARGMGVKILGHPSTGLPWTLEAGAISNFSPEILQISAALAPGNSGGPVLNEQNEVVGIVYETTSPDLPGITAGFGFAYPLSYLQDLLAEWGIELRE